MDLFIVGRDDQFAEALLSREQAESIAHFCRSEGLDLDVRRVKIEYDICHTAKQCTALVTDIL